MLPVKVIIPQKTALSALYSEQRFTGTLHTPCVQMLTAILHVTRAVSSATQRNFPFILSASTFDQEIEQNVHILRHIHT
jgi:hypothetical protein